MGNAAASHTDNSASHNSGSIKSATKQASDDSKASATPAPRDKFMKPLLLLHRQSSQGIVSERGSTPTGGATLKRNLSILASLGPQVQNSLWQNFGVQAGGMPTPQAIELHNLLQPSSSCAKSPSLLNY